MTKVQLWVAQLQERYCLDRGAIFGGSVMSQWQNFITAGARLSKFPDGQVPPKMAKTLPSRYWLVTHPTTNLPTHGSSTAEWTESCTIVAWSVDDNRDWLVLSHCTPELKPIQWRLWLGTQNAANHQADTTTFHTYEVVILSKTAS
jgi:hypothetical protein